MSSFKKIAWSGSAVLLALVMALSVMAPTTAQAASTVTSPITGSVWNGVMPATVTGVGALPALTNGSAVGDLQITEGVNGDFTNAGTVVLTAPAGVIFVDAGSCSVTGGTSGHTQGCSVTAGAGTNAITITFTDGATPSANPVVMTLSSLELLNTAARTAGAFNITSNAGAGLTAGTVVGTVNANQLIAAVLPSGYACVNGAAIAGSFQADANQPGGRACASFVDSTGLIAQTNVPLNFTVSAGILGTGTSKTATVVTATSTTASANGVGGTDYRGAGGTATTDTLIVTNTTLNLVATRSIPLTAPGGSNASKMTVNAPTELAVAATITNTSPGYVSPKISTNLALQVTDAGGAGVANEVILISTDKGALVLGFDQTCGTAKAVTGTTASLAITKGGEVKQGVVQLTFCAVQTDAPGKATITASNVTTTMANGTVSISMAGRPSKVEATATGNAISAKVTDSTGAPVADGTPVRFTMSSNAGAVSTACTTTSNGAASAVVALIAATGTVIVSADWNETGVFATCAAAGSQQIAASVTVPGGTASSGGTGSTGGTGVLTSGSVPATGFGLIVFGGGTVAQLVTASGVGNSGALYATVGGNFVPYVPGTTIAAVNADFLAAFPGGNIPANTAFVGRK